MSILSKIIQYFSSNSLFQIITRILHSSKDSDWCWLAAAVKINPRTLSDWSFRLDKPRENNKKRIRIYDREKLTIVKACEICSGIFVVNIIRLDYDIFWFRLFENVCLESRWIELRPILIRCIKCLEESYDHWSSR